MTSEGRRPIESVIIKAIFESIPVGLLVIDPEGRIAVSNECAWTLLGYSRDELAGKGWGELFLEREENLLFNQVFVDVIWEQKLNLHRIVPYTQPAGETLYLSVTTSFVKSGRGVEGIVVLLDDVTELHRIQIHEKIIFEEKETLQRDRTEGLHKLAMAIAHQVRNPTTAIGGFALRMLKTAGSDPTSSLYLQNILNCVRKLETIVTSIQEYTQIPPVVRRPASISRIIEQTRDHAFQKARSLNRYLDFTVDCQAFDIEVDDELLILALDEIMDNAIEFGREDIVTVHVSASRNPTGWFIRVDDCGASIAQQDLPFVFDPFFTTKATGVGMGLCKAKRIVTEHGGQIRVESAEGEGTVVVVQIPDLCATPASTGDDLSGIGETKLNDVIVVYLSGRLDASNAARLRDKVKDCFRRGLIRIVIDLARIDFVDSSGLGGLVTCLRTVKRAGGGLKIAAAQDRVRTAFELIQLHQVFDLYEESGAAVRSFQSAPPPFDRKEGTS